MTPDPARAPRRGDYKDMKSEQDIREKIEQLERLKAKHDEQGDYGSKLDVANSIRLLQWVVEDAEDSEDA